MHRPGDGIRQLWIPGGLVVQHAVRFDVAHHATFRPGYRRQRTDLIQRLGVNRVDGQGHGATAEVFPIRETWVRPHCHAVF